MDENSSSTTAWWWIILAELRQASAGTEWRKGREAREPAMDVQPSSPLHIRGLGAAKHFLSQVVTPSLFKKW